MNKYYYSILLLSFTMLTNCSRNNEKAIQSADSVITVSVHKPLAASNLFVTTSGKLVAKNSVNISTRIMSYITLLKVEVGQTVKAGQLLISINATDIEAKSGQVNAQIAQAQANFNIARKDYERFQNLYKSQSASQKELDDMRTRYEMAKASVEAAQQMKNEVNAQYNYSNITAPLSGTITAKFAEQGDMARPGMPLLTIESPSSLQVQTLVSEQEIMLVKENMPVQVAIKSINKTVSGIVTEISKSAANTGGQYLIKINLSQTQDVLPGMFANIQFPFKYTEKNYQPLQENVMIPKSALVEQGQLTGVYVISSQNTALLRWIKTGRVSENKIEVISGLQPNEVYITSAEGRLYNGVKVKIK
ncbi:MAG: efflux RND transporter periplasmic adaptor subunit [Bacteroidetes bacterium]|nr:efflux RND transporter periplasmic adaptor subunit [Bacteroidota bacterium]